MMLPTSVRVFVAVRPIDLRVSFDRLAGVVRDEFGQEPRSGSLFVFRNKANDRCKVLFHDRTGYCLLYKRLDAGTFAAIRASESEKHLEIEPRALATLLEGIASARREKRVKPVVH